MITIPILPILAHIVACIIVIAIVYKIYRWKRPSYKPGKSGTYEEDRAVCTIGVVSTLIYIVVVLLYYGIIKFTWF